MMRQTSPLLWRAARKEYWGLLVCLFVLFWAVFNVVAIAPDTKEASLADFQAMDRIAQRNWLYTSLDEPGFSQSPQKMEKALSYINRMDWKSGNLDPKDVTLVDKFVQKVPMDMPQGKNVANRYFDKISGKKLSIQTGKDLQWNGKMLTTKSGAMLNPRKIPDDVTHVDEINGNLVFQYKPIEEGFAPAKVILQKGELEVGGMNDEITQPSRDAQFTVKEGDATIGGVRYHPDNGKIVALGDDNFKITDYNLNDDDPASILILGENRGLRSDVEVLARQRDTFIGTNNKLFGSSTNGLRMDGSDLYAKGDFGLALSEFDKDENFAEYTFKNGILDTEGRVVTPEETNSKISLHYNRNGESVVWDVDGDDFEVAPKGMPNTPQPAKAPQPAKPKAAEVRTKDEESPKETKETPATPIKAPAPGERPKKEIGEETEGETREDTTTPASEGAPGGLKTGQRVQPPTSLKQQEKPTVSSLQEPQTTSLSLRSQYTLSIWVDMGLKNDLEQNPQAKSLWDALQSQAKIKKGLTGMQITFTEAPPTIRYYKQGSDYVIIYNNNRYRIPSGLEDKKLGERLLKRLERE